MHNKTLSIGRRLRCTPFTRRVEAAGVKAYTIYNHMLLPAVFESVEADYEHLCEHVQVWDVAAERQVELNGPDAAKLAQLMTPRDLSKIDLLQGKYAPICNAEGFILNDPIIIKLSEQRFWVSIADSDVKFFAQGLAQGYGLDVNVFEPDVSPLAVQGPKADELMSRVFGDVVRSIRFFRGEMLDFMGASVYVARSGWSKQGGFEIYLSDSKLGEPLWDELFAKGEDLNVRAGCPNGIERLEAGLLSFGNDMDEFDTPFECGLDSYLNLDADIESLSLPALKAMAGKQTRKLVGVTFSQTMDFSNTLNTTGGFDVVNDGQTIGEIRAHAWSPRFNKHLAYVMLPIDFIDSNKSIEINAQIGMINDIPFSQQALTA